MDKTIQVKKGNNMIDFNKVEVWYSNDFGTNFNARLRECTRWGVKGICVPSSYMHDSNSCSIMKTAHVLHGIEIVVVVGFPFGTSTFAAKVAEIVECNKDLVSAVDVTLNCDWICNGEWKFVREEIIQISLNCSMNIRWALNMEMLTEYCMLRVADMVIEHGGDIKLGKEYEGHVGVHSVEILRKHLDTNKSTTLIKAAGNARSGVEAIRLLDAGADVVGIGDLSILF
jgi:deoxyribose-phosphate aldolase